MVADNHRTSFRAVFLDRDGVLNRTIMRNQVSSPPWSTDELQILDGVITALNRLKQAGFLLIVVTNQPDVARGAIVRSVVEDINATLQHMLPLDSIEVCWHDTLDNCDCRKPRPGLLLRWSNRVDIASSYLVGDRWRDIGAARAAGCTAILVASNNQDAEREPPDYSCRDLNEAADWILSREDMRT